MTEVLFYHLTESTLEEALPGLLGKCLERGWRVTVQVASEERRDALDQHLWTFSDDSFLAHGLEHEPHVSEQPIVLTTGEGNPNAADVRFLVDGAPLPDIGGYARAVVLFDGYDNAQLEAARGQWKLLREAGHAVTYWQQGEGRRWEKKA